MANAVLHRVWNHSQARGAARCLLLALADVADDRGIAYPGVAYLATMINETRDYTDKLLDKLIASGELFKIAGKGRGHVTRFAVLCGLPEAKQEHLKGVLRNPFSVTKKGQQSTPLPSDKRGTTERGSTKGGIQSDKRGTVSDSKQASFEALEPYEPPIDGSLIHDHDPTHGVGDDRARAKKTLLDAGIYPATVRQILALKLDWPTVIRSTENLIAAEWGPGAIADRLRQHPPTKGQPYEPIRSPSVNGSDSGRNGTRPKSGGADRTAAARAARPGDPAYYATRAKTRPDGTPDPE